MVEELLRGQRLPAGTLTQIVAQTDGVPLFVEEVTKAVLEAECAPDVAASDTVPLADAALQRDLVTLVAAEPGDLSGGGVVVSTRAATASHLHV
jgi:hypothetical protein